MDAILNWMKEFLILYLMLTVALHLAATEEYKKYLRFLSGVILMLALISPLLRLVGLGGKLEALRAYGQFWESLDSSIPYDYAQKTDFLQNGRYIQKYEKAVAADIQSQAEGQGIPVSQVSVCLSEGYEISRVTVWLDALEKQEDPSMEDSLISFLEQTYKLDEKQIFIN